MNEIESVRNRAVLCCAIALLAAAMFALVLLNVAELQGGVMIVVRAQTPEASERPALDIGVWLILTSAITPLVIILVAFWRRWSLAYYLAWIVATALLLIVISAVAAFAAYRYWREHQTVVERPSVSKRS